MRIEKVEEKQEIIDILDDVRVPGTDIILEKGDRIVILSDAKIKKSEEDDMEDDDEDEDDDDEDDDEVEEKKKKK